MKEEIKKQIEQEAKKYAGYVEGNPSHEEMVRRLAYENGANFILSKWQEAERWRKVEEEMPEHSGEPFLIRGHFDVDGNRCYWRRYFVAYQDKDFYKMFNSVRFETPMYFVVTGWKPIVR